MRRTKVVCTIGPASASREQLERLGAAGQGGAPREFLPRAPPPHPAGTAPNRAAAGGGGRRWGRPVAILQDLQGPKIRLGTFGAAGGVRVDLEPGHEFTLCASPVAGRAARAAITRPRDLPDVCPGA